MNATKLGAYSIIEINILQLLESDERWWTLCRAPHFNIKLLYSQILKKQLAFFLIDSSFRFMECSITKLALDNFTRVATIRRKYTEINGVLESIGLSLKDNTLRGKEEQIRWFYAEYYWFVFKGIEWTFSSVSRSNIIYMINKIEKETQNVLSVEMKERLSYWID